MKDEEGLRDVKIGDCVGKELEVCVQVENLQGIIRGMKEVPKVVREIVGLD